MSYYSLITLEREYIYQRTITSHSKDYHQEFQIIHQLLVHLYEILLSVLPEKTNE